MFKFKVCLRVCYRFQLIPPIMTEILLHTTLTQDIQLQKINTHIYYDSKGKTLYKLSFLPHGVIFHNQSVIQPRIASLTKCDPHFLAINLLCKSSVQLKDIPQYLANVKFQQIADPKLNGPEKGYSLNKAKVFDWLEKKVSRLHQCFQRFQDSNFKTESSDRRYITSEMINILKCQLQNTSLVDEFAGQRYSYSSLRKRMPEDDNNDHFVGKTKSKPKKQTKKEQPKLQHNQKTLFGFIGKPKP